MQIAIPPQLSWLRQDLQLALAHAQQTGTDVNGLRSLDSEIQLRIQRHWHVLNKWAKDKHVTDEELFQLMSENFETFEFGKSLLPLARELMN